MVIVVTILAYISTILSAYTSYGVSILTFPHLLEGQFLNSVNEIENIKPYFSLKFPPIIDVMSALLLAFIIGIGISKIQNSYLLKVCEEFENIISNVIAKILIPALPLYIFGIF